MSNPSAVPLTLPGSASAVNAPVSDRTPSGGHVHEKGGIGVGKGSANAPHTPFRVGEVPRACWCCIEVAFNHPTPNPEHVASAHGLAIPEGVSPEDFAAQHGFAREYATAETLAAIARRFDALEGRGRGICITRDHASFNEDPDTRAAGWIRKLHAEGEQLWAWVEWTPWGHEMVNGGEYIHFSTEYEYHEFKLGQDGAQPTHLTGCTITNEPRHRGQIPCTNSERTPRRNSPLAGRTNTPGTPQTMNTKAKNSDSPAPATEDEKKEAAANGACRRNSDDTPPREKPTAVNNDQIPQEEKVEENSEKNKPATAANIEQVPEEETALNEEDGGAEPLVEIATMLNLPDAATPADVVAAVADLQRSNEELQAALAEANRIGAPASASNSVRRFPHLTMRNSSKTRLEGQRPNRDVNVRVGSVVRAINTQAKNKGDYCTNAVDREEKSLGRRLTPKEYQETYSKAMRDYEAGVGR